MESSITENELETRSWTSEQYEAYQHFQVQEALEEQREKELVEKSEKRGEKRGEKLGEKRTSERFIRQMISMDMPIEQIAAISGLPVEDIKTFKKLIDK
jgi:predicted transposase/invertase (TIGR01784 family)